MINNKPFFCATFNLILSSFLFCVPISSGIELVLYKSSHLDTNYTFNLTLDLNAFNLYLFTLKLFPHFIGLQHFHLNFIFYNLLLWKLQFVLSVNCFIYFIQFKFYNHSLNSWWNVLKNQDCFNTVLGNFS